MWKTIKQNKWQFYWSVCLFMILLLIAIAIFFEDRTWLGNVIQTLGTIVALYAGVLVHLQSREESDKQFREQLEHLQELNSRQIEALYKSTERQIDALQQSTFKQISSFERQTRDIAEKLSENSILLAEILGRELEKAISQTTALLEHEERQLNDLKGFKLFRTEQEKQIQVANKQSRLSFIKNWIDHWNTKYNKLMNYFGFNQKLLDRDTNLS
jgi:ABC-type multidrug transport system fused ATPase/permease subunit